MLTHFLPDSANSRNLQIHHCSPANAPCLVPALILTQPRAIVKKNFMIFIKPVNQDISNLQSYSRLLIS